VDPRDGNRSPLRVALLGLGTVGKAVAQQLLDTAWRSGVAARGITPPELVAVGVRDPDRPRGLELPSAVRRTDALDDLVVDDGIDVVVELIGGLQPAGSLVGRALESGRHVVTGNKALLACEGHVLESAAREAGTALRFEASVAGGVPVLAPIVNDLAGNRIDAIRGIVNGTTNHILSAMAEDGRDYEDVLSEAQERGYAEADPSGDVEAWDAAYKLAILARLGFGEWPEATSLRRAAPAVVADAPAGITGVRTRELERAASLGLSIKLVARAERGRDGCSRASIMPVAVRGTSPLGSTGGVTNLVEVIAEPVGRVAFRGPGAGGRATSSAVLADLLAIARGEGSTWGPLPPAPSVTIPDDLDEEHSWFFVATSLVGAHTPPRLSEIALAADDEAFVTRPMALAAIRERLAPVDPSITIYPLLAEA
jgi:homoserine dehydrogenase